MIHTTNNEHLWEDSQSFELYKTAVSLLSQEISSKSPDAIQIKELADGLDQLFQSYEEKYSEMKDPLFYWWFAFANAILVMSGEDSFKRKQYAVNGFKTGLSRHCRVPSFSQEMIDLSFKFIEKIKPGADGRGWVEENRTAIKPA